MPSPALFLTIATLLPLLGFVILLFWGKRVLGNPYAGYLGTAMIAGSFVLSMLAMIAWYSQPKGSAWGFEKGPINLPMKWIPVGDSGIKPGEPGAQAHPGFLDVG